MTTRPVIGITCSRQSRWLPWLLLHIELRILGARGLTITPQNKQQMQECDGFIIMGGTDIDPTQYGKERQPETVYEADRDLLELDVTRQAIKSSLPLLGICRGMQVINVAQGGTLHREVSEVFTDFLPTNTLIGKVFARREVDLSGSAILTHILQAGTRIRVNSLHHQAVETLGKNLQAVATEENGLIQALEHSCSPNHPFLIGVQWHPELMPHSRLTWRLLRTFVHAAAGVAANNK